MNRMKIHTGNIGYLCLRMRNNEVIIGNDYLNLTHCATPFPSDENKNIFRFRRAS